jgi:hypothetical protein
MSPRLGTALAAVISVGVLGCAGDVAPSGSPEIDWGPLAVSRGAVGSELAQGGGTLRITAECAFLDNGNGDLTLLVWSQRNVQWDPVRQVIRHHQREGRIGEFRSGDQVLVGGGGGEIEDWAAWVAQFDWAAAPKDACRSRSVWGVGAIELQPLS